MTTEEVSEYLKIPVSTLWKLTRKGKLRGTKVGKHWRYREEDVQAFLTEKQPGPKPPQPDSEKRQTPRLNCEIPAEVSATLSHQCFDSKTAMISNISAGGAFVVVAASDRLSPAFDRVIPAKAGIYTGDPVKLVFNIPEVRSGQMELDGRVVRVSANGKIKMGIKFRAMSEAQKKVIQHYVG